MGSVFASAPPSTETSYSFKSTPHEHPSDFREHRFYPYTDNGGSTLGITGADYAILAGDTRMTSGYNIQTRYAPKLFRIGGPDPQDPNSNPSTSSTTTPSDPRIVLSIVGFSADAHALHERLQTACTLYTHQHSRPISLAACAQRLSHILYAKRFFPFYVTCILGGLDEKGVGALYSYDPVGSYEREQCRAAGAASSLIMPFLDNQVSLKNQYQPGSGEGHDVKAKEARPLPRKEAEELVRDAFAGAVERHIEVGDGLQMMIVDKDGVHEQYFPLKKD